MENRRRNRRGSEGYSSEQFGDSRLNETALVFKGRFQLKEAYLYLHLCTEEELEQIIKMPSNDILRVIPLLKEQGLTAAQHYLNFKKEGLSFFGSEELFSHQSREKLAILYLILKFELNRNFHLSLILRDELLSITKMSELVNWIANLQNEKDIRQILEKDRPVSRLEVVKVPEIKPNEAFLSAKELSSQLNISTKTITRHPEQFKGHWIGKRKYYYLTECIAFKKKI